MEFNELQNQKKINLNKIRNSEYPFETNEKLQWTICSSNNEVVCVGGGAPVRHQQDDGV